MKKEINGHRIPIHTHRYDPEQGFQEPQSEPTIIVQQQPIKYTSPSQFFLQKKVNTKNRYSEAKTKLKFLSINQAAEKSIKNSLLDKQFLERRSVSKSLDLKSRSQKYSQLVDNKNSVQPVIKSNRALIGENLVIPNYALHDNKPLKSLLASQNQIIIFESAKQQNSHGLLKKFMNSDKKSKNTSFMSSKFNILLKQRIRQSYIMPKAKKQPINKPTFEFQNNFESSNIDLVSQISQNQFHIYLRNDTNTHGHQNWFYFSIQNHSDSIKNVQISICNLKRDFSLINCGQKIFYREINKDMNQQKWKIGGQNISIKQNTNPRIARGKIYKLTFTLDICANKKYEVSMLPAYTYSKMLSFVQQLQGLYQNYVQLEILCYSLMGLAVPILTISNKSSNISLNKQVILISCRIHPGQTVSSYVLQGFLKRLLKETSNSYFKILDHVIFHVIPMINPDGVVFGNFRTNFLGIDMNRGFNATDQILHPQIVSLKEFGRRLRKKHGKNFVYFLDLHGHSCQKNIFTYGPNFQYGDQNFYVAKLLPLVLDNFSKYFDYDSCTFQLEEHKNNTARGFFLKELNVMTYTVQSSYAVYQDYADPNNNRQIIERLFEVDDWLTFGSDLLQSIALSLKILIKKMKFKSHRQVKKAVNEVHQPKKDVMNKLENSIKKQMRKKTYKQISYQSISAVPDSDGQSEQEDLNSQQRKQIQKKVQQTSFPNYMLPRVVKPIVNYPTVTPKLFQINQDKQQTQNFKYLFTKRNKYSTCKVVNSISSHLPQIEALERLKPQARNIRLQKKLLGANK